MSMTFGFGFGHGGSNIVAFTPRGPLHANGQYSAPLMDHSVVSGYGISNGVLFRDAGARARSATSSNFVNFTSMVSPFSDNFNPTSLPPPPRDSRVSNDTVTDSRLDSGLLDTTLRSTDRGFGFEQRSSVLSSKGPVWTHQDPSLDFSTLPAGFLRSSETVSNAPTLVDKAMSSANEFGTQLDSLASGTANTISEAASGIASSAVDPISSVTNAALMAQSHLPSMASPVMDVDQATVQKATDVQTNTMSTAGIVGSTVGGAIGAAVGGPFAPVSSLIGAGIGEALAYSGPPKVVTDGGTVDADQI